MDFCCLHQRVFSSKNWLLYHRRNHDSALPGTMGNATVSLNPNLLKSDLSSTYKKGTVMKSIDSQRLYFSMLGLVLSIFVFAGCHAHHHGHHHGHNHAHDESETASQSGLSESELEAMQMQASQSGVSNTEQKSAWCSEFPKSSVCN